MQVNQSIAYCSARTGSWKEPQPKNKFSSVGAVYSNHSPMMPLLRSLGFPDFNFYKYASPDGLGNSCQFVKFASKKLRTFASLR